MKKTLHRWVSMVLVFAMLFGNLPITSLAADSQVDIREIEYIEDVGLSISWDPESSDEDIYFQVVVKVDDEVVYNNDPDEPVACYDGLRPRQDSYMQSMVIPDEVLIAGEEHKVWIKGFAENDVDSEVVTEGDAVYYTVPEYEYEEYSQVEISEIEYLGGFGLRIYWDTDDPIDDVFFHIVVKADDEVIYNNDPEDSVTWYDGLRYREDFDEQNIIIPDKVLVSGEEHKIWIKGFAENDVTSDVLAEGDTAYYIVPEPADDYEVTIVDEGYCGDDLSWVLTSDGTLTISGTGAMDNYEDYYDQPWHDYFNHITSVVVEDGVTSIGQNAFLGFFVWHDAFQIQCVELPDSLISIGERAFYGCERLSSINIPNSVRKIDEYAFCRCTSLTSVTIPENLTSISKGVFSGCTSLESITIPEGVTSIGESAFEMSAIEESKLEWVRIPASVTEIGTVAFRGCSNLCEFIVAPENEKYSSVDGVLLANRGALLHTYPAGKTGDVIIPESVTTIGRAAFQGCTLESVVIPEGVETIMNGAFAETDLVQITIPKSVTQIREGAFQSCKKLSEVYYIGTAEEWNAITIEKYNQNLTKDTTIHFDAESDTNDYPTIVNFTLNGQSGDVTVKVGEALTFGGIVEGNGNKLKAVSIAIRSLADESKGGNWHTGEGINQNSESFDLSDFNDTVVTAGEAFGNTTLVPGEYVVQVYATNQDGNGFAEEHKINLTIKEKEIEVIYPTIENFTLNGKSESVTVEVGEALTLGGIVSGNGSNLSAVSVAIRSLADEGKGGNWHTGEGINQNSESFDLSDFNNTVVIAGEAFGNTTLVPGEYVVQVYATNQDGNGFVEEHKINLTIKEKEIEDIYPTIENFTLNGQSGDVTVEVGEALTLGGIVSGNGSNLSAVSVAIRSLDDEGKGGNWHTGEGINQNIDSFDLSDFNDTVVTAGEAFGNTTLVPGAYVVQVYATNQEGNGFVEEHKINLTIKEKEIEDIYPTIENFTLNGQSGDVTVEVGEALTLGGIVSGNGSNLSAVSVAIRALADEGRGGKWHTGEGVNLDVESFDLSDFNDTVVTAGEVFGNTTLVPGEYVVQVFATNQDNKGFAEIHTIALNIVEAVLLGDVNSDGEVTSLDRLVLGRYINGLGGYPINRKAADIDKNASINQVDYDILSKYLAYMEGYENLEDITQNSSVEDSSVWKMSFSEDTLTINLKLEAGHPIQGRTYQFIAEKLIVDADGKKSYKHYACKFMPTNTTMSFAIKEDLHLPRGKEYTFYVVPLGVTLDETNREKYSIGNYVVPLYGGNMIEWVKSGNNKVENGGNIVLGEALTVRWNGSYGVDNFQLQIDINENQITLRNYASDGPKEVEIPADLIMAGGVGEIVITGTVTENTSEGVISETSIWKGNVIENPDTTPDYPDYIDAMPYDLAGEYQLARQIDAENSDILAAISKAISQGVTENLKTYIWSNISPDKYDQKEYETVITRILRNIPNNTATQIFDEIDKMASLGQDVYGGTQDAFSILTDLWKYGYTEEICEEMKTSLEPLKQFSDLSEKSMLLLIVQYKGQLEYFDALESQVPSDKSMKPLKDAIIALRKAYKESYVSGVAKILAQYYTQEGFNEFVDFVFDGIKEGAGDTKIWSNVKLGNIFNGLSIADFAMTYGSKVLGITDYANASFDIINASAIESMASCAYMEALAKVKMAKDEATNKDYAYLAACYDLVRGCIITKNEYAMTIDSRYAMVAQLKAENKQITNRPYGMYQKNVFYMSDFMNAPDFDDLGTYYFNAIITGGAYSDKGIGYIAKYSKMSTAEKRKVKKQIELLSEFAIKYQKSDYFTLELRKSQEDIPTILIRTPDNYFLGITVYNGTGTIQVPCVFARHPDWDEEYYYLMSIDDGITAWGDIVAFDRLNLRYHSIRINKAGVEKILRKFVDTQYNKSDVDPVSLGKELVVELFGEVLNIDNYWYISAYDEVAYAMANSDIKNGYK